MADAPISLPPGSMTVPPWFGWGEVALVVALAVLVGLAACAVLLAGRGSSGRSEWQAWLDGRSTGRAGTVDQGTVTPSR